MRTRTWLLYIVLAVLIPAFVVAALGIVYVYQEEQFAFRKSMQETARALSSLLDKEMAAREAVLRTLAVSPAIGAADLAAFQSHASAIARNWGAVIFLADPGGRPLVNTRLRYGDKNLPRPRILEPLRSAAGPDATVITDVYVAPIAHTYSVAVQIPVKHEGRLLYYLGMGSYVSRLQSIFTDQNLPSEWVGTIVDRKGVVAAKSDSAVHQIGALIPPGLLAKTAAEPEGRYDDVNPQGVHMTTFFSRAPLSGWTFIVSVPQSIVQGSAIRATWLLSGAWLAFAAIAIVGALLLARRTSKPIEALRNAAGQLGRGEPVSKLESGIVEVDAVSAEMHRASERLLHSKAELEEQVADAVAATARSQRALLQAQKLEALGRLTGGIAHDFNNVLQALNTGLHLMRQSDQDERAHKALDACQRSVKRATELTGQLAVFGRTQDSRLEVCALDEQIKAIRPLLESAIRSDIDLQIKLSEGLWPVKIDTLQFELAILNLVINARDAMPDGGRLAICAKNVCVGGNRDDLSAGDYVLLSITDNGSGMDSEVLTMALEPFFSTKAVGKGSGMGLPQAYGFAKLAGGMLTLESKPCEGTCVALYMARTRLPRQAQAAVGQPSVTRTGGKLLFVEDDALVRDVVGPALIDAGFDVETAATGDEAYRILRSGRHFDIVFSDVVMPGVLSGTDLAELIEQQFPAMRTVLASGYSDRLTLSDKVRVLPKPYDLGALIAMLNGEREHAG